MSTVTEISKYFRESGTHAAEVPISSALWLLVGLGVLIGMSLTGLLLLGLSLL